MFVARCLNPRRLCNAKIFLRRTINVALHKSIPYMRGHRVAPTSQPRLEMEKEMSQAEAKETISKATTEAIDKSQEMFSKAASSSEKMVEGMIEYNAAVFKGGEVMAKKMFDTYIANVATGFANAKAMAKATDVADFYKIASEKTSAATEAYVTQSKEMYDLGSKVYAETTDTAKKIYSSTFSAL